MPPDEKQLINRQLPKWPQMYVTGKPVAIEDTKEIIRRTDAFFMYLISGGNHETCRKIKNMLGMPDNVHSYEEFHKHWKVIPNITYLTTDWIAAAYAHGPYGWIHPDGTIGFVDNIGKWPTVPDVLEEWGTLSAMFPFLDVGVTLYNAEHCDPNKEPVVSIVVKDGTATLADPDLVNVHKDHAPANRGNILDRLLPPDDAIMLPLTEYDFDTELPWEWFEEWAEKYKFHG